MLHCQVRRRSLSPVLRPVTPVLAPAEAPTAAEESVGDRSAAPALLASRSVSVRSRITESPFRGPELLRNQLKPLAAHSPSSWSSSAPARQMARLISDAPPHPPLVSNRSWGHTPSGAGRSVALPPPPPPPPPSLGRALYTAPAAVMTGEDSALRPDDDMQLDPPAGVVIDTRSSDIIAFYSDVFVPHIVDIVRVLCNVAT